MKKILLIILTLFGINYSIQSASQPEVKAEGETSAHEADFQNFINTLKERASDWQKKISDPHFIDSIKKEADVVAPLIAQEETDTKSYGVTDDDLKKLKEAISSLVIKLQFILRMDPEYFHIIRIIKETMPEREADIHATIEDSLKLPKDVETNFREIIYIQSLLTFQNTLLKKMLEHRRSSSN